MEVSLATITLTVLFAVVIYKVSKKRMQLWMTYGSIPGPLERSLPIFGHAMVFRGDQVQSYRKMLRVVGGIRDRGHQSGLVWMGSEPVLIATGPDAVEVLLRSSQHNTKAMFYDFLHPWLGRGLLTSDGEKWKSRRRLLTPTFHFNILQDFLEVMNEQAKVFISKLDTHSTTKDTFDIFKYVTLCALDIICETAMGKSINAMNDGNSKYVRAVYRASELVQHRQNAPWFWWDPVYYATKRGQEFATTLEILHGFTRKIIFERMQNMKTDDTARAPKKRLAFLDMLLEASDDGNVLSLSDIQEEVDTFMFEGHDTTAAAMSWALHLIGTHDDVQAKLHEEVDKVFANKSNESNLRMDDLKNLEYLELVIKESLRLFPSVPAFARKTTSDCVIDGHNIPVGTSVTIFTQVLHLHPKYWTDPRKFSPERFTKEACVGRHPFCYIPFSAGPRNCIGQRFALMEEKVILAHFLRRYTIKAREATEQMELMGDLILRPRNGVNVDISKRC